jgi:hypothetical protein
MVGRQAIPPQILSELTVAEKLKEAGSSEVQAAALTRAIEAAATAKAELVEARMNKDLETSIERSDAKFERSNASFEKTVREQIRWIAIIVFSAIGLMIAFYGIALHFQVKARVREKALQKQARRKNDIGSTGRPAAANGGSVPPLR